MTDTASPTRAASAVAALRPLLGELNALKRIRTPELGARSLAEHLFGRAWGALAAGAEPRAAADQTAAAALVAVRLGGLGRATLVAHGLDRADAVAVLQRAFDSVAPPLDAALRVRLRETIAGEALPTGAEPAFVPRLCAQPRAGATHPGRPRLVLEPAESHGDHCLLVAVYAVLLAPGFGAEPADAFLVGLAHHLQNATLPDAGYAADVLLGEALAGRLVEHGRRSALAQLDPALREAVERVLPLTQRLDAPAARAFHAADVLDRVLEMAWHARAARFTLAQALAPDGLNIVHAGPEQAFQRQVLTDAGLWTNDE